MTCPDTDIYQERYFTHQVKKKTQLTQLFESRVSQRIFNNNPITVEEIYTLLENCAAAPSSCNRQAVYTVIVTSREDKELLSGLLVGGVGWVHRADTIILLFASKEAYKAEGEISFMPYLDAGVVIAYLQLAAEDMNIGSAYINPNIRPRFKDFFSSTFNADNDIFCGALALGHYDVKAEQTPKKHSLVSK